MEGILNHLAECIKYGVAARAFLEKYLVSAPVLQVNRLLLQQLLLLMMMMTWLVL